MVIDLIGTEGNRQARRDTYTCVYTSVRYSCTCMARNSYLRMGGVDRINTTGASTFQHGEGLGTSGPNRGSKTSEVAGGGHAERNGKGKG